jgi:hypothetical protein
LDADSGNSLIVPLSPRVVVGVGGEPVVVDALQPLRRMRRVRSSRGSRGRRG